MRVSNWSIVTVVTIAILTTGCQGVGVILPLMSAIQSDPTSDYESSSSSSAKLQVASNSASVGDWMTVSYNNSLNGDGDWIGFFAVGSPDDAYLAWTFTGNRSDFEWTVPLFGAPGFYEFRLFRGEDSVRVAVSPAFQVVP